MRRQVHALGRVMSNESVAAAAAFQDSLQNLQTGIQGLGQSALSDFLPSVTEMMDGLTALMSGDSSGLALISQGISAFAANLSGMAPVMQETGSSIMQSLLGAITDNLPLVIDSGADVLLKFINGIVGTLPQIAEAALGVIQSLSTGIAGSLAQKAAHIHKKARVTVGMVCGALAIHIHRGVGIYTLKMQNKLAAPRRLRHRQGFHIHTVATVTVSIANTRILRN